MRRILILLLGISSLLSACNFPYEQQFAVSPTEPLSEPVLATPYAMQPAAGICGRAEGETVEIFLEPGIPNPRCVQVVPGQILMVTNRTGQFIVIALGDERAGLGPGESYTFEKAMGELLALGVHQLYVDPCCGGEIMMVAP